MGDLTDSYYQFYPNPNPNPWQPSAPDYPHNSDPYPQFTPYSYDQNHPNPNPNPNTSYSYDNWSGSSITYNDDDEIYKYEGGSPKSSSHVTFDDYGRPINNVSNDNGFDHVRSKVVKAIPKSDAQDDDVKGGLHKFRVNLLSEGFGQTDLDILCQIGLDGIRMLDPATNRTLRIYPLETVTRWEVLDSYIFAFWTKMPADIEPKRNRLKSNSYTTNSILDIVTAASVQLKEIGERKDPDSSRASQQNMERKKGFVDWMNLIKPPNEEKDHWVPDEAVNKCTSCGTIFNAFIRKHHCRNCGEIFCDKCTQGRTPLTTDEQAPTVRVCDQCMGEVTQRLDNAKEGATGSSALLSHEDLAKKLKDEMSRNSKVSTGSKSEGSQSRMRDVACPTCTVHLQVEIPTTGSEKIECSVCQHPFLVNAD